MFQSIPRVTVIIPNFNQSHFVGNAIRSVLDQTLKDFEIIVVDDGSTDNSQEVVAQFGAAVRYIYQQNQGLAGARNTGLQYASGELIGLLDADDEWSPQYLEYMVAIAEKYPDAVAFYCMAHCMDVNKHDLPQIVGGPPVEPRQLYQVLLRTNFIIPSTVTFRTKPIIEAGCFDANLRSCEDWDLWLRLLSSSKIMGVFNTLVRYRVHGSSLSTDVDGMHTATKKVVEKHFGKDEGEPSTWSPDKRRAYGGVYRYQCITYIQRQNNWVASLPVLIRALQTDPTLAVDVDLFYELALGVQPVGYRGAAKVDDFEMNAAHLQQLVLEAGNNQVNQVVHKRALGTTSFALALVSYNLGTRSLFRKYFTKAIMYRPELILDAKSIAIFFKSFLSKELLEKLKKNAVYLS